MSDNVKEIAREPNQEIIKGLKKLLDQAEKGEIYSIAMVALISDQTFISDHRFVGNSSRLELIGALQVLSRDIQDYHSLADRVPREEFCE